MKERGKGREGKVGGVGRERDDMELKGKERRGGKEEGRKGWRGRRSEN